MSEQIEDAPEQPESIPAVVRISVGEILRTAREAAGLQVADIAQTLKLGQRQVESVERGEWDALPGHTFTRGFVRNYARLMHVDPAPLMAELDVVLSKPVDTLAVPESSLDTVPVSSRPRDRAVVLFGGVLVILAVLAYFLLPNDLAALREGAQSLVDSLSRKEAPVEQVTQSPPVEPAFPPGSSAEQTMTPQAVGDAAAVSGGSLGETPSLPVQEPAAVAGNAVPQLRFVVTQESWLEVKDGDGAVLLSQRVAAGSEPVLQSGKGPLSVAIGFAPGVKLFLRGQPVDLASYTRGDVARLVLE